jgi:hypothetical protein
MAHFAKVVDGKVVQVIVAEPEFFESFVDPSPGQWIQTSYNTRGGVHYLPDSDTPSPDQSKALRKNFAGIGYTYDAELDAFIEQQPYPSWTLNSETARWQAPIPEPEHDEFCSCLWDESTLSWVIKNG